MTIHEYSQIYTKHLQSLAQSLEIFISDILNEHRHIDRISARAKSPERFAAKAAKLNDDGSPKYKSPVFDIQDQIGARIIVFYLTDVPIIEELVLKYFRTIEFKHKEPERESEFGYVGTHMIVLIPEDIVPDDCDAVLPKFFELQIKTLFQHAWSEAHHDLGYKSARDLTTDERRRIAFTAAQAWGADRMFDELAESLAFAPPRES